MKRSFTVSVSKQSLGTRTNYITLEDEYLYELLPGFIAAFLTVILVSALTEMPSEETLGKFDAVSMR